MSCSLRRLARRSVPPLAAALAVVACTKPAPHATTVLAKVPERIVILPLNVAAPLPAELKSSSRTVWNGLEVYLRAHGVALKTVSSENARALWLASVRDARADPKTKDAGFDDAARVFVGKLKQLADFDAVIVPSLYVQRAVLAGTKASWDGSERTLEIEMRRGSAPIPEDAAIEGAVPAVSLHAAVFDGQGAKLQETRAGLALLVRARMSPASSLNEEPGFTLIALREPFADRTSLMHGIAQALAPFVPPLPPHRLAELGAQLRAPATEPEPANP